MENEDFLVKMKQELRQEAEEHQTTMAEAEAAAVKSSGERIYSVYLNEMNNGGSKDDGLCSFEHLRELAKSPQSSLENTLEIINLCRQFANIDDIIGLTTECIENNVNTTMTCAYHGKNKEITEPARQVIDDFNQMIDIKSLISRVIPTAWRDGTCIFCLRRKKIDKKWVYTVDFYPLGVAVISDYEVHGQPYILIDITELKSRLVKNYPRNKKRKGLFFNNMEEEIRATYPIEVYRAYMEKERWAKIPIELSGVCRVNNQNKRYGLSPIFRALWPTTMLDAFGNADRATANARSKKIIVQTLHKEILGENYNRDSYGQQQYAHHNLMEAWKQRTVVLTAPATVSDIKYVEPKAETTNINLVNHYRQKAMGTLGISFLADSGSSSLSIANISLKQLMKNINKIANQLECILEKWYAQVLRDSNVSTDFTPIVKIQGAEMLDLEMRRELAETLFTKLNCSYETAYELYGIDYENEKNRRKAENDDSVDEIFMPRLTAYTASGDTSDGDGRPADPNSNDPDKQGYDKLRNKKT